MIERRKKRSPEGHLKRLADRINTHWTRGDVREAARMGRDLLRWQGVYGITVIPLSKINKIFRAEKALNDGDIDYVLRLFVRDK